MSVGLWSRREEEMTPEEQDNQRDERRWRERVWRHSLRVVFGCIALILLLLWRQTWAH